MSQFANKYDLEERTAKFGENVILLCRPIRQDEITKPIINQLIRSATSIGANYCEANNASSKKDFTNKIFICKKEARETKYWLRMLLTTSNIEKAQQTNNLPRECQELILIFQKICSTLRK